MTDYAPDLKKYLEEAGCKAAVQLASDGKTKLDSGVRRNDDRGEVCAATDHRVKPGDDDKRPSPE